VLHRLDLFISTFIFDSHISSGNLSMTGSGKPSEPEEDIADLVERFGLFIKEAKFELDDNGVEKCTDPQLKAKARHLFKALGFEKEVNLPLQEVY